MAEHSVTGTAAPEADGFDIGGYEALRQSVGAVRLERDVCRVSGPDAISFLQGQLSQDVAALAVGDAAWSLVLQPQGKVDALIRVVRTAADAVIVDVDAGHGEALLSRLGRFKLRTKADLVQLPWSVIGLRGPGVGTPGPAGGPAGAPRSHGFGPDPEAGTVLTVPVSWPGLAGSDLLGPDPAVPDGVPLVSPDAYEAARIEAGIPRMGVELTDRTIPAEAGLVERTVSFTKGCYTGQELVARIDSRGSHVPRYLRGLVLDAATAAGSRLVSGGKDVGWLTSVAWSPKLGFVALGYVGREVSPPATLEATTGDGHPVRVEVRELPLAG